MAKPPSLFCFPSAKVVAPTDVAPHTTRATAPLPATAAIATPISTLSTVQPSNTAGHATAVRAAAVAPSTKAAAFIAGIEDGMDKWEACKKTSTNKAGQDNENRKGWGEIAGHAAWLAVTDIRGYGPAMRQISIWNAILD